MLKPSESVEPHLIISSLPENEQAAARLVSIMISQVTYYVRAFEGALALFDICEVGANHLGKVARRYQHDWTFMALRDGTMTIYHFGLTLQHIGAALGSCPALGALVDHEALRKAKKQFSAQFPRFELMRHSVAHEADLTRNEASLKRNMATFPTFEGDTPEEIRIFYHHNLTDRTFTTGIAPKGATQGELVSYDMSKETLIRLAIIRNHVYSGFRKADVELRRILQESEARKAQQPKP